MQRDNITPASNPVHGACICCQENCGAPDCWSEAYKRGRNDFIAEVHTVLATDYDGHSPDHSCDVCRITKALAMMTPSLQTVMDGTADWMITIVSDPVARESLKTMITLTEESESLN